MADNQDMTTNTHHRTARQHAKAIDAAYAGRDSARRIAAAIKAIPQQDDYTRDMIETALRTAEEMESEIDYLIESAAADGYSAEDIERASY